MKVQLVFSLTWPTQTVLVQSVNFLQIYSLSLDSDLLIFTRRPVLLRLSDQTWELPVSVEEPWPLELRCWFPSLFTVVRTLEASRGSWSLLCGTNDGTFWDGLLSQFHTNLKTRHFDTLLLHLTKFYDSNSIKQYVVIFSYVKHHLRDLNNYLYYVRLLKALLGIKFHKNCYSNGNQTIIK